MNTITTRAVVAAAIIAGASLLGCGTADAPVAGEATAAPVVECAVVDLDVATNLEAAGHDLEFERRTWTLDGVVIGTGSSDDEDFDACGDPSTIALVRAAQP